MHLDLHCATLGPSWEYLVRLWAILGSSCGHLGAILGLSVGAGTKKNLIFLICFKFLQMGLFLSISTILHYLVPILLPLGHSWGHLGASWGHFWDPLGPSWGHPGHSWSCLGAILAHLGAILGHLKAILDHLRGILTCIAPPWVHLGGILAHYGLSWGHLGAI